MAAPMRSTDFRSIVEPILNECFDGVYTINAPTNGHASSLNKKASPVTTTKSQSFMDLVPHLSCLTALLCRTNKVACCSSSVMSTKSLVWHSL